ncbi:phosphoribosyl-AMP cyclohydrolase [Sphingopyxis sp. QXT-31]|uniref:phosphoribosyl-AMP cyclohydrolase n=1 Tax=Sphingopyxis sp. QXT-31 TaxID=1357916 RepID=UPI00097981E5|nr:phosphoribosyl-AMP cyclohydrolase [Sphingopyxis sp. QXT-31]APZ98167.1 phosphoribosyl-AMP cyclohydrolase [Sphingopyxis sp. QXT-31]
MTDIRDSIDRFDPRFDAAGLVTAIVTDAATGALLMVAHMNADAIRLTQETGQAHFWSRSRGALWRKGETSGNGLTMVEMRVDCDQDALLLRVTPAGPACHTGRRSCFYRRVEADGSLTFLDDDAQG